MKLQHMKLDYIGRGVRVYVAQEGNGSVAVVLRNEGGRRYRQTYRSTGGDGPQAWDHAMADALAAEQRIIDAVR